MSTKAAEDLSGVIVRTVEFVSDPPQEGEGAHRLFHLAAITPALQISPLGKPQGASSADHRLGFDLKHQMEIF